MRVGIAALSVGARLKERRGGGGRGEENLTCPISSSLLGVCLLVEGRGSRVNSRGSRVTSRRSRVNGRGSKNPPQLFLNIFQFKTLIN